MERMRKWNNVVMETGMDPEEQNKNVDWFVHIGSVMALRGRNKQWDVLKWRPSAASYANKVIGDENKFIIVMVLAERWLWRGSAAACFIWGGCIRAAVWCLCSDPWGVTLKRERKKSCVPLIISTMLPNSDAATLLTSILLSAPMQERLFERCQETNGFRGDKPRWLCGAMWKVTSITCKLH